MSPELLETDVRSASSAEISRYPLYALAGASFEAARRLPECGLHGHGFRVRAAADAAAGDLTAALHAAVAPLDYMLLNDRLASPTDAEIARHVADTVDFPLRGLRLRSAPGRGVEIAPGGRCYQWHGFRFEASHRLPNVPEGHKCGRWHGHGFEVRLYRRDEGEALDVSTLWAPIAEQLNGACLNELNGLENPTSEMIARWLWLRLDADAAGLACIGVFETRTSGCVFDGHSFRIWKSKYFESAVPQMQGSARLSGHSYWLRLHLAGDLDRVQGWVRDFGDVKARLGPVYDQLDHHRLDRLEGGPRIDLTGLLYWLDERLARELPELAAIDLWSTPSCGAMLCRRPMGVGALL